MTDLEALAEQLEKYPEGKVRVVMLLNIVRAAIRASKAAQNLPRTLDIPGMRRPIPCGNYQQSPTQYLTDLCCNCLNPKLAHPQFKSTGPGVAPQGFPTPSQEGAGVAAPGSAFIPCSTCDDLKCVE